MQDKQEIGSRTDEIGICFSANEEIVALVIFKRKLKDGVTVNQYPSNRSYHAYTSFHLHLYLTFIWIYKMETIRKVIIFSPLTTKRIKRKTKKKDKNKEESLSG